jgi:hypothetical protein
MLGLLNRSRRPARPAPRPVRPCLEGLEARDCPSYLGLNVSYGSGKQITLYGTLMSASFSGSSTPGLGGQTGAGGSAAGVTVAFSGSASGSVTTDSNGNFKYTINALSLGEVDAATTDGKSNVAKVVLASSAPVISGFMATEEGNTNYWNITGHVTDGNFSAAGLVVHINGSPVTINYGGQGLSATVDASDNFNLCVCLNGTSSDNGNIDASVTDAWGLESNDPIFAIMQPNT